MDAVLTPFYPMEQSIAPKKQNRIHIMKKNGGGYFISNSSENFDTFAGLSNPLLPPLSAHLYRQNQQPPLLPLPNVPAIHHHQPLLSRSLSSRKNSTRETSPTPKKSKPTKREEAKKRATQSTSEFLIVASDNRRGPDAADFPKHLPVVFTSSSTSSAFTGQGFGKLSADNIDVFSGSVFSLSPPPSSLPLPKFSLRSKLSCNAEAAGIDAGATDNLQRLLRLR